MAMTMRDRMLALVRGLPHDRVPFVQYHGLAAPNEALWDLLGRDTLGVSRWLNLHRFEAPHCRFETETFERNGQPGIRRTLVTPEGNLTEERMQEPTYGTTAAFTHFVKEPEDYRILLAYLRDVQAILDLGPFREAVAALGEDGLPHTATLRSPYQQLWIEWVGIQDLSIHLTECNGLMNEVFTVLSSLQQQVFEVVCRAAREVEIPYVVVPDNITAPMIGARLFRQCCVSAYDTLAGMLAETGQDIPVFVHMDGDLKPLWNAIGKSRVRGLDSMSPPPDNDTPVGEALARWPEMRILINFPSSVHLAPPDAVYRKTMEILEEGGRSGRLQIQLSENVPPYAWRTSLPPIVRAIRDFGAPG